MSEDERRYALTLIFFSSGYASWGIPVQFGVVAGHKLPAKDSFEGIFEFPFVSGWLGV